MTIRIETLDLEFQGTPETIASYLVEGPRGYVLVETGPGSTLPALHRCLRERGLTPGDIRHVLVTHIHFDHAGAAGWWAREGATVYVHSFGAPHLIDPARLIASATRIYGDQMHPLWGEILSAPADRVVPLVDGDRIEAAGLEFIAIETPGHARHHHAFRLGDVGFTGDAAGIRLPGSSWIDLPAPPPEFDLKEWQASLDLLRGQNFSAIYPTHFGQAPDINEQYDALESLLVDSTEWVGARLDEGQERDEIVSGFREWVEQRGVDEGIDQPTRHAYEVVNPRHMSANGIMRYLRKQLG